MLHEDYHDVTTRFYVQEPGKQSYEFYSFDSAEFFALRMSEASNAALDIRMVDRERLVSKVVRTVQPYEFKRSRAEPPKAPPRPLTPYERALQFMRIVEPFNAIQLKGAFRTLAKEKHPDTGGSQNAFLELQINYDLIIKTKRW